MAHGTGRWPGRPGRGGLAFVTAHAGSRRAPAELWRRRGLGHGRLGRLGAITSSAPAGAVVGRSVPVGLGGHGLLCHGGTARPGEWLMRTCLAGLASLSVWRTRRRAAPKTAPKTWSRD